MDTHPPHPTHHPDPSEQSGRPDTHPTADPAPDGPTFDGVVAAVVGDLLVPIAVYRLICAYSRPGEAVVDQADGHTFTATGHAGGRHRPPGRFTDTAGLPIGPATGQCHG